MLTELAPAKINLFLHVTGRRPDGYHLLDSMVVFASIADRVSVSPAEELTLEVTGPMAAMAGPNRENLVLRAAHALKAETRFQQGAHIRLEKQIPAGAGLGGGSSDAATALRLLDRLWNCGVQPDRLSAIGLKLGADIPVCLRASPTRMTGIGENLESSPISGPIPLVLVHPGGNLATREVFAALGGRFGNSAPKAPDRLEGLETLLPWLQDTRNDLEVPAISLRPEIAAVIGAIRSQSDCLLARMSGSGAASFGLFRSEEAARKAVSKLHEYHPEWWIRHGFITTPKSSMN